MHLAGWDGLHGGGALSVVWQVIVMSAPPSAWSACPLQVMFVKYKSMQVEDAKRRISRLAKYDSWALASPQDPQHVLGEPRASSCVTDRVALLCD
jgi:hypothetical protein